MRVNDKWFNFFLVSVICQVALFSCLYFWQGGDKEKGVSISCSSSLEMLHDVPVFLARMDVAFRLLETFTGQINFSGNVAMDGEKYVISRLMTFSYEFNSAGEITIADVAFIKNARDNMRDEIFRNHIIYIPKKGRFYMKVSMVNGAYLIENSHSPMLLCVDKKLE